MTNLLLRAWGMGSDGHTFVQEVQAHNISSRGVKISGIEHQIGPGDVIGLQLPGAGKARFRVVWIIGPGHLLKFHAGLQFVDGQQCPWTKELAEGERSLTPPSVPFKNSSSKVDTTGVVRASDGGVRMGIEFSGLDLESQERLQQYLKKLEKQDSEP